MMSRPPRLLLTLLLITGSFIATHSIEYGKATYYGKKFHGRRTASGERLYNHLPSAAHRTLPFGSWVRITNLSNNTVSFARIIDRGPFRRGRIIDVSYMVAEKLNFLAKGVTDVSVEQVTDIDWAINTPAMAIPSLTGIHALPTSTPEIGIIPLYIPSLKKHHTKKRRKR